MIFPWHRPEVLQELQRRRTEPEIRRYLRALRWRGLGLLVTLLVGGTLTVLSLTVLIGHVTGWWPIPSP